MDLLKAMRIFVRVVEAGSLTAAAEHFQLSATMIGNHLQSLESHLGTKLLSRTTRRQSLTAFGAVYYARCLEILALVDDAETMAQVERSAIRGTLRVSAPGVWARAALMPAIRDYLMHNPQVDLDLVVTDTMLDFVDHRLEAAIRLGTPPAGNLTSVPLRPYELVLCAAPAYLAQRGTPLDPAAFAHHDGLAFGYPPTSELWAPSPRWRLEKKDGSGQRVDIPISRRVTADNAFALHAAALEGLGIAMLPRVLVEQDLNAGRLQALLDDYAAPSLPLNVLYRKDRRRSPRLESFLRFMTDTFS